jgi:chaperonin GroEL (HSP60 family)
LNLLHCALFAFKDTSLIFRLPFAYHRGGCYAQAINILKAHGKSAKEIYLLNGYALNTGRAAQGMLKCVAPARIARLDVNLQRTKLQMGIQVLVTDPRELEKIRQH